MPTSHNEDKSESPVVVAASATATATTEDLSFDQALDRLRQVVQRLEQGNLPLDQALKAFEEGVRLSRRGSAILDAAEQRVELLLREDDGSERRQPLNPASANPPAHENRPQGS